MSKLKTIAVLGVGYVLGAKAGRGRYEQLRQQATRLAEHPRTQQLTRSARERVADRLPGSVTQRLPESVSSRLRSGPTETAGAAGTTGSSVGYPGDPLATTPATTGERTAEELAAEELAAEAPFDAATRPSHL